MVFYVNPMMHGYGYSMGMIRIWGYNVFLKNLGYDNG